MSNVNKILMILTVGAMSGCGGNKNETPVDSTRKLASDSSGVATVSDGEYEKFQQFENYLVTAEIPADQLQVIDSMSAVVVNPTDEQISAMIKENGEEDFSTIADDAAFYQSEAITALDSFQVKTILAEKRYLKLVGKTQSWVMDIRREGAPEWNVIFFDPSKNPRVVPAIEVSKTEILSYFGIK